MPATPLSPFRLTPADLAHLDAVAATLAARTGRPHTRTDAIRWAIRLGAEQLDATPLQASGSRKRKKQRICQ